jgi:ribose transport system ATP-binding protein
VILAKAFNTVPVLVLLDEPTAGVDVGAREAIYELLRERAREGVSFVISSSDVNDLVSVCDRVLVLNEGEAGIQLRGDEVTERSLLDAVTTGRVDIHATAARAGSESLGGH